MFASPHIHRLSALAFCLGLLALASEVNAQGKSDVVRFETVDGVKLEGVYYPSTKGTKAPCVLMLHDFDFKNGGNCRTDGWDSLATKLQEKGYAVLTFDFRGFGQSTGVNPGFWRLPHNAQFRGAKMPNPPKTISYKEFYPPYYRNLASDVAAAKAWLDNESDGSQCNSRNLIVVGAGQGATVGLMWMASEFKRYKGVVRENLLVGAQPILLKLDADSEGKDLVCGVWLSISPTLGNQQVPLTTWISEVGKAQTLPMAFIYGDKDNVADANALRYVRVINPTYERGKKIANKNFDLTGDKGIPAKLTGSKLLDKNLDTEDFIIGKYIEPVLEKHRFTQWKARDSDNSYYYWKIGATTIPAKIKGEKMPLPLPPQLTGGR